MFKRKHRPDLTEITVYGKEIERHMKLRAQAQSMHKDSEVAEFDKQIQIMQKVLQSIVKV